MASRLQHDARPIRPVAVVIHPDLVGGTVFVAEAVVPTKVSGRLNGIPAPLTDPMSESMGFWPGGTSIHTLTNSMTSLRSAATGSLLNALVPFDPLPTVRDTIV